MAHSVAPRTLLHRIPLRHKQGGIDFFKVITNASAVSTTGLSLWNSTDCASCATGRARLFSVSFRVQGILDSSYEPCELLKNFRTFDFFPGWIRRTLSIVVVTLNRRFTNSGEE